MSFKKILGQDKAVETLKSFIASARVPRAMIFAGPAGVAKAAAALEFAKTLNCLDPQANKSFDNCGICQNCRHIDARTHPDVIFADFMYQAMLEDEEAEKQQTIKVDTVRKLTTASQQKHVMAKWKVYIIDAAERLTTAAANALLKFIEEPAPNTVWILVSSKKEAMLSTVKSRSQTIIFAPLKEDVIETILKDNYVEDSIARKAAFYAQGSTAKAFTASEILNEYKTLPRGAAFAPGAAMALPRSPLAAARLQAACALDMLSVSAHKKWIETQSEEKQEALKDLLAKMVFYKKAINRNTSPSLVLEAALIAAEEQGIDFKD
jgi:DNA polymerase-3 subunit delta'